MQKALRFIRECQEEDGSWYGRWGVNYIYGTWQVLRGLRAINVEMNQDWLIKARDWLESVQHEDGGWGERCNTYDDPVFKGQGPSTASQTAWAVMGLCAFDSPQRPSIRAGIDYLIRKQNDDGSWTVVIAHRDPGHPNWISTSGHRRGRIWFRWFHPVATPERPTTRVVPVDDAGSA